MTTNLITFFSLTSGPNIGEYYKQQKQSKRTHIFWWKMVVKNYLRNNNKKG
jgi:hypothetical protein